MQKFTVHKGLVAPMDRENVDTDAIIPKQFLKSIRRAGFGVNLFDAWRYLDHGEPGMDAATRRPNPDFVLNEPRYKGASILLARRNFGCGSSREHAPWALADYGFRVIIAPSFADIFFGNCCQNGLLPVVLPVADVQELFRRAAAAPSGYTLTADLVSGRVFDGEGFDAGFGLEDYRREMLLQGLDEIGRTLLAEPLIAAFEQRRASAGAQKPA
jgi:3-isopropylmalate/(R)-2-methylmalate dehydratase small subunit